MKGTIYLRNGGIAKDSRMGWCPEFDPRSRMFAAAELLPDQAPVTREWALDDWLDQGKEGACVGFGFAHELAAEPFPLVVRNEDAFRLYREAQKVDQWPGEDYEGSSVLAGAKVCKAWGVISEYRWTFSLDEALRALSHLGPLVIGVNWYAGMFEPNRDGYISPSGIRSGGHCVCVIGIHTGRRAVRIHNSWGPGWGEEGRCWLSYADFGRLIEEGAEVCVPITRSAKPIPNPGKPAPKKRRKWWFW